MEKIPDNEKTPSDYGQLSYYKGELDALNQAVIQYEEHLKNTYNDFIENDDNVTDPEILAGLDRAYDAYDKYLNKAMWNTKKIDGILSKVQFEGAEEKLIRMGKAGTLSIESITAQFPELIEWLNQAGISVDEFYQHIMSKADPDAVNYGAVRQQMQKHIFGSVRINPVHRAKLWSQINSDEAADAYQKLLSENNTTYWTAEDWVSKIVSEMHKSVDESDSKLSWSSFLSKSFDNSTGKELLDDYENTISSICSWLDKLESEAGLTQAELQDLKEEFPELGDKADITKDNLLSLSDDALQNFIDRCGNNLPEGLPEDLKEFSDQSLNTAYRVLTMSDAISALDTNSKLLAAVNDEISKNGQIADDTFKSIIASYPMMAEAAAKYHAGKFSGQDILTELEKYYRQDIENYENAIQAKQWYDTDYYDRILDQNGERLNKLAEMYKVDISNCQTAADARFKIEQKLLHTLGFMWGEYYGIQRDPMTGLYNVIEKKDTEHLASMGTDPGEVEQQFQDYADMFNQFQVNIDGLDWKTYSKNNNSA